MSLEDSIQSLANAIKYHADAIIMSNGATPSAGSPVELGEALAKEANAEAVKEAKPTPKKAKAKAKPEAKKAKPAEVEPEVEEEIDDVEPVEVTANDVRTAAMAVRDEVGREDLADALKKFKSKKISDLGDDQFADFVKHCDGIVEAGANA